jgi:hypothetical protein
MASGCPVTEPGEEVWITGFGQLLNGSPIFGARCRFEFHPAALNDIFFT